MADKEAIRECLYRYCRGIGRADEALVRSAYWADARDCHGAYRGTVDGFIAQALPRLRAGGRGVHQLTNCLIELHVSLAAVESSLFALQTTADSPNREVILCGRYLDRFEKRGDEWRVADRTVVYDWMQKRDRPELAQDDVTLFGRRQPTGARAPKDPLDRFLADVRARAAAGPTT